MTDQNVIFGERAIRQGLVTEHQLGECMAELTRLAGDGAPRPLSALMVERGLLDEEQARALLVEAPARRLLHCKQCKKTYRVEVGGDPPCKTCGGPLVDVTHRKVRPSARRPSPAPPPVRRKGSGEVKLPLPLPVAPAADPSDHLVGRQLSAKYELLGRIGHGAMGAVYQARHLRLDRLCAVKILPQELACDPELMERFRQEARTTARLEHINVVRVFEVDSDQGYEYLAMEYVEGVTLAQLMQQQPVRSWRESADIVRQAALGLGVAHARQVIHRDIKPANLMLNAEGTVKVMDFGLARLAESGSTSRTGTILGTPHFMSPEQARGDPVDLRTDIYSLGATLYNLLTGRTPFQAPNDFALLLKAMEEEPVPPHEVNPRLPLELSAVVQKMMAKDRELRYAGMAEVAADLELLLEGQTGQLAALETHAVQRADDRTARVLQQRRRKLRLLYGLLALNLLLVAGAVALVGGWFGGGTPPDKPSAVAPDPAAKAYAELTEFLQRGDVSAQEKAAACNEYLEQFPDSPKADQVRKYRELFRKQQAGGGTARTPRLADRKRTEPLLRELERARRDDDKPAGRRLLAQLEALGADPLGLEEYQVWLGGGTNQPGALRPSMAALLLQQIRETLLEGKLDQAERMAGQLAAAKTLSAGQQAELAELVAVLAAERKAGGALPQKTAAAARGFYLRIAAQRIAQGALDAAAALLAKALRHTPERAEQARIHLELARLSERLGRGGEVLQHYQRAWDLGLRERSFVERHAWALFSRKRYAESLPGLQSLAAGEAARFTDRFLLLVALRQAGRRDPARALAAALHQQGVPLPASLVTELAPRYDDLLLLTGGARLSGKLVASNEQTVTFRWREGRSVRFRVFPRAKVKQLVRGPLDEAGFRLALQQHKQKSLLELKGLIHWAEINGRLQSEIDLLEDRLRFVRGNVRRTTGIACETCAAQGVTRLRCETCGGGGAVATRCETCNGEGKRTCGKCGGAGEHVCPGPCRGTGWVDVQVSTQQGKRTERRRCGDCKGQRSIRCLRCGGNKTFLCTACRGRGKTSRPCAVCRGRKTAPCTACAGRGVRLDAWSAFVLGAGHHLLGDATAVAFWQDIERGAAELPAERKQLILDQLPHLGLTDLLGKLGR